MGKSTCPSLPTSLTLSPSSSCRLGAVPFSWAAWGLMCAGQVLASMPALVRTCLIPSAVLAAQGGQARSARPTSMTARPARASTGPALIWWLTSSVNVPRDLWGRSAMWTWTTVGSTSAYTAGPASMKSPAIPASACQSTPAHAASECPAQVAGTVGNGTVPGGLGFAFARGWEKQRGAERVSLISPGGGRCQHTAETCRCPGGLACFARWYSLLYHGRGPGTLEWPVVLDLAPEMASWVEGRRGAV